MGSGAPTARETHSLRAAVKSEADGGEVAAQPLGLPMRSPVARTRRAVLDVIPAHLGAAGVPLRQVLGCDGHSSQRLPSLGLTRPGQRSHWRTRQSHRSAPGCLSLGTCSEHVPRVVPRAQKQVENRRAGGVGGGFRAGLGAGARPWEALSKPAVSGGGLAASGRPWRGDQSARCAGSIYYKDHACTCHC